MKTLAVSLPDPLVQEIEAEASARGISTSDVVRERLTRPEPRAGDPTAGIADLIGSVLGLAPDLSVHRRAHLRATGYGDRRPR